MAITNNYVPVKVSGDGVTVLFSFNFQIYATSDLFVTLISKVTGKVVQTLALGTNYSVAISSTTEGGTITCVVAPAATVWILIQSALDYDQPTSFTIDGKFSVASVERALDRQCRLTQQLKDPVDRSVKIPASEASDGINLELPPLIAGKAIGIGADAKSLVLLNADSGSASAAAEAAAADATAQAAAAVAAAASAASAQTAAAASAAAAAASAAGIATKATQAQMEAGTDDATFVTPLKLKSHPGVAKAWVNFDGSGSQVIGTSYNVSSITDNGNGDFTINWTVSFSSANYTVIGTAAGQRQYCAVKDDTSKLAGSVRMITGSGDSASQSDDPCNVAAWGDQ